LLIFRYKNSCELIGDQPVREKVMITFQRLGRYIGAEPFRPFRINMASGQSFEIRDPEMISVGRSSAHIFTFMSDEGEHSNQREHEVSLHLMKSVDPLDVTLSED
jgi:hypothetical protein